MIDPSRRRRRTGAHHVRQVEPNWLRGLKAYLAVAAVAKIAWEIVQLPLYTIWTTGTAREMAFSVLQCTGGDVLIALSALTLALIVVGTKSWPAENHQRVLLITLSLGIGYTIFSEWLNIVARSSWAYSSLMPAIPVFKTGLSPLLQWIGVPLLSLTAAKIGGAEKH